jgi:hypothetical protein
MSVTIYSKSHPNRMMTYKVRRLDRKIFDLWTVPDATETAAKLKAIGIDAAFLSSELIDFDYEAELVELMIDYEMMFPEDSE